MTQKSEDEPRLFEIQNTEKKSEELRRIAITNTPVKDHQQTMVCKKLSSSKIILIRIIRIIPIEIGALGTVTKGLMKGLEEL